MAKAGVRRSQAPNLCHAEAKIGPERDIALPRCRRLNSRRFSRTAAPKSGQSLGTVFTQPGSRTAAMPRLGNGSFLLQHPRNLPFRSRPNPAVDVQKTNV